MNKINLDEVITKFTGAPLLSYSEYLKMSVEARKKYITGIYNICAENGITFKIAFGNEKGGTGKTLMAVNVSYMASQFGIETLSLDNDPQGSMTSLLGGDLDITQNQAFKKRIDSIPKVDDIYYDHDKFVPRPLYDIDIAEEFSRPKKVPGLVPLLEKMFVRCEEVSDADLKDIVIRPMLYLPNSRTKREDSSIIYKDELIDYGFDLVPASSALFNYGITVSTRSGKGARNSGYQLTHAMDLLCDYQGRINNKKYGLVVCDLAPSVDIISLNGMAYCEDGVIGVITPNYEVLNGIYNIMETLQTLTSINKKHLGMPQVVLNRNITKNKMSRVLEPAYVRHMFQTRSPEARISNLMSAVQSSHNEHMVVSQFNQRAYQEFEELTTEILYLTLLARIENNERLNKGE